MTNPLLNTFKTEFQTPDFTAISIKDYEPAFKAAMASHLVEIDAIANTADAPTFANTIDVLELTGQTLDQINSVFWNLSSTDSTPGMRKIESSMSPKLSNHASAIHSNRALFDRIDTLFQARGTLKLSAEQMQTLVKIHTGFIKGGAKLGTAEKTRAAAIKARLATLTTNFSQNVLRDETDLVARAALKQLLAWR